MSFIIGMECVCYTIQEQQKNNKMKRKKITVNNEMRVTGKVFLTTFK